MMLIATTISIIKWRRLTRPDRIISILLLLTIVSEAIGYFFIVTYQNNMYVYHVFSPIELGFLAFYYNEAIPFFRKKHVGLYISLSGVILTILNACYLQPIKTFPSLFLLFEGFIVIILSLFSFFSILYKEDYKLIRNVQFWVTFNLLIFWSFTFLIWGTYISFSKAFQDKLSVIFNMLSTINFIEYLIFALIFFFYEKMVRSGE